MSLLELFGEHRDPGPSGTVEWQHPEPSGDGPRVIVLRALLAVAACGLIIWWAYDPARPWPSLRTAVGSLIGYLALSAVLSPQPDDTNMGWLGGVIDNPFRWSDDVNRWLLFLRILVTPGRLVVGAWLDVVRLVRVSRRRELPPGTR